MNQKRTTYYSPQARDARFPPSLRVERGRDQFTDLGVSQVSQESPGESTINR
jgi:hypothetical protein